METGNTEAIMENTSSPLPENSGLAARNDIQREALDRARNDDDYWHIFTNEIDRVKADVNGDERITYEEYYKYLTRKDADREQTEQTMLLQNKHEYTTQHYYHLDSSFYIVIGMLCVTAIIITYLRRK